MGLDLWKSLKVRVSLFKYVSQVLKLYESVVLHVQTFLLSREKGLNEPVHAKANISHSQISTSLFPALDKGLAAPIYVTTLVRLLSFVEAAFFASFFSSSTLHCFTCLVV